MSRSNSPSKPRRRQIAALDVIEVEGSSDAPTIILLHGFGADMTDLASLAAVVQAPPDSNWIFPNGPLAVPVGGHFEGRGWFPISISELQKAAVSGQGFEVSVVPPGFDYAKDLLLELIDELRVEPNHLVIGGFSQGAMVATEVALQMTHPPAGLAVLSGTLLNATVWQKLASDLALKIAPKKYAFFQSHGVADPVLSIAMAARLEKLFLDAGWSGQLLRFSGGHEIPPEVIKQFGAYLRRILTLRNPQSPSQK